MAGEFDDLKPEQLRDLARACGVVNGRVDPLVIPRAQSMRTRMRYARAAFIGDVRVPLVVFVVLLGMFFSGWFVAQKYYHALALEQRQAEHLKWWRHSQNQYFADLARLREESGENVAYRKLMDDLYYALEEIRREQPELYLRNQDE